MIAKITGPKAEIVRDTLSFQTNSSIDEALETGVMFIKIPSGFNSQAIKKFATSYYLEKDGTEGDPYKGYAKESFKESILGYSSPNDQVELLQLELSLWKKYFPKPVFESLLLMNDVSKIVLKSIFHKIGASHEEIDLITGGMDNDKSLQYCIFNHYRSARNKIGFTAHKDSGFITTLYSIEPGLESYMEGRWVPIDPIPGYFTVNLGHSLEVLSSKMKKPIHAVYHHVRQTDNHTNNLPDRFSVGTYLGPRFDMDLYQYKATGELVFFQTFLDFQIAKAKEMGFEFHPRVQRA